MSKDSDMEWFKDILNSLCFTFYEMGLTIVMFESNTNFHKDLKSFLIWYTKPEFSDTTQYKQPYSSHVEGYGSNIKETIKYLGITFIFYDQH